MQIAYRHSRVVVQHRHRAGQLNVSLPRWTEHVRRLLDRSNDLRSGKFLRARWDDDGDDDGDGGGDGDGDKDDDGGDEMYALRVAYHDSSKNLDAVSH